MSVEVRLPKCVTCHMARSNPEYAQKVLEQALKIISPSIAVNSEVITLNDKSIMVVTIPKGTHAPYLVNGQAYERIGGGVYPMSVFAPDVHTSAYEAVTSGSGALAQGRGSVAALERGVIIGGEVRDAAAIAQRDFVSYDVAFERVVGSTAFVLNQLELSYTQTREQAQGWFRFSLIAAGIGFVLIGLGVIAVIFGQVTAGIITAISSIIPNAAAALFFVQSKTSNERVDAIQLRLTEARELQTAVEIANTVDDPKSRDKLKAEIVRKALRLEPKGEANK